MNQNNLLQVKPDDSFDSFFSNLSLNPPTQAYTVPNQSQGNQGLQ
jgi:hypothetical protein